MNEYTVGDIVRYYRQQKNMTQGELAEIIGDYTQLDKWGSLIAPSVSRLENGRINTVYPDRAFKFAKALSMSGTDTMAFVLINSRMKQNEHLREQAWDYFIDKIGEEDLRKVRSPHRRAQPPRKTPQE